MKAASDRTPSIVPQYLQRDMKRSLRAVGRPNDDATRPFDQRVKRLIDVAGYALVGSSDLGAFKISPLAPTVDRVLLQRQRERQREA
jgi:hypothetical protein